MKRIYLSLLSILVVHILLAQQLQVGSGASVTLGAGSSFSSNGLTLTPTSPLTLTGLTIDKNSSVTHPFGSPYVTRVYQFNPSGPAFTGNIRFNYLDGELNGLTESSLQLIAYNGITWQMAGSSTNDASNNFVEATGVTKLLLSEMILASNLALPLRWGAVAAYRQQEMVLIRWVTEQEQQVSHFDIEKSWDAVQWLTVMTGIPATNQSRRQEYLQTDRPDHNGRLYYRIRQTDLDGRYTFSKIAIVAPVSGEGQLVIRPNPVSSFFSLSGVTPATIAQVSLFNAGGHLLKTWTGYHAQYTLPTLVAGTYYVRIQLTDGNILSRQVIIR
jgi:hypothetical protein